MLIAVSIWLAVGLYLVLFFSVLHLVDSLAASRPERERVPDPESD